MVKAFMTDPDLLASLEGQQYLVLRPIGEVGAFYGTEQTRLLQSLPAPLPHPDSGHVTLRGFFEPDRVDHLRTLLTTWSASQPPIRLQVEGIDGFPPPFQVLIARLHRTGSLLEAYTGLTDLLDTTDLHRIGELPVDEWVFHLSLAYARTLDLAAWQRIHHQTRRALPNGPVETVLQTEFVWYQHGTEHRDPLPLGNATP